jgi:integrase
MYVQQKCSVIFLPKRTKINPKTGLIPIYVRLAIDGQKIDRAVAGIAIHPDSWDGENKVVKPVEPKAKAYNKQLAQLATDLLRSFDLVKARERLATPKAVWEVVDAPDSPGEVREEKKLNLAFSLKVDKLIKDFVVFHKARAKAYEFSAELPAVRSALLADKQAALHRRIDEIEAEGNRLFDNKQWTKTLVLAIDEHLLHFIALVRSGHRSFTTLEKMLGRKARMVEFIEARYKEDDLTLSSLEFELIEHLETFCMTRCAMTQNTASKYTATFKDIITRAVSNGWVVANIFLAFRSPYKNPKREWLTWEQMYRLIGFPLSTEALTVVRDLYVFEAFTGYAYAELRSARPSDLKQGIDGKVWISKARKKTTSDETLPFLPIALELIDKYRSHPLSLTRGTLFPVPTNEYYNRSLKAIALEAGIDLLIISHSARYFFANEVLFNNGVQLKTIARIMGHDSIKSAEIYVRANRTAVSESMDLVESKLYNPDGTLRGKKKDPAPAKVATLRVV